MMKKAAGGAKSSCCVRCLFPACCTLSDSSFWDSCFIIMPCSPKNSRPRLKSSWKQQRQRCRQKLYQRSKNRILHHLSSRKRRSLRHLSPRNLLNLSKVLSKVSRHRPRSLQKRQNRLRQKINRPRMQKYRNLLKLPTRPSPQHVEGGVPVQTGPAAPSAAGSTAPSAAAGTREGQEAGPSSTADSSRSDNGSAAAAGSSSDSPNSSAGSGSTESDADIASRFAARVEANKEYPYSAVRLGQTGSVTIWADLSADGALEGCGISSSSGISSLDQSALKAVRASCPFPHGAGHSIHIVETIYFNLNE